MQKINFLIFLMLTAFLASCGESKGENTSESEESAELTLEVESGQISGELGKYFEIVAKSYKINVDGTFLEVNFEIKRIAEGLPMAWAEALSMGGKVDLDIHAQLLDENGNVIDKSLLHEDEDELAQLSVGETTTFICHIDKKDVKKVKGAKFNSKIKVKSKQSDSENDEELEELNKNVEEVGKVIDSYGKAVEAIGKTADALKNL